MMQSIMVALNPAPIENNAIVKKSDIVLLVKIALINPTAHTTHTKLIGTFIYFFIFQSLTKFSVHFSYDDIVNFTCQLFFTSTS
jgi:hypothetical protein